ncbi:MAG: hypothetical protein MUF84_08200 [Anaerolineae bacterium]|jgi:hypothetical protein|nr:hypothetical protein [Anaerolineae bacterium]
MTWVRVWRLAISLLVLASLVLNVYLVRTLLGISRGAESARTALRETLVSFSGEPIIVPIAVDEEIPVQTTLAFSDTLVVPFQLDYTLDTVVSTSINIPLLGRQSVAVPVYAIIPISETLAIPIQMDIPISMSYPLKVEFPVAVEVPAGLTGDLVDYLDTLDFHLRFPFR